jgi:Clostripain family
MDFAHFRFTRGKMFSLLLLLVSGLTVLHTSAKITTKPKINKPHKPKQNIITPPKPHKPKQHNLAAQKPQPSDKKKTVVLVYMAAANDLGPFADRNLEQMKQVGSNDYLKILVHIDTHRRGSKKTTQRFIVHKNKLEHVPTNNAVMDSGDEKTFIDACLWALQHDQNHHQFILIAWNHGTGPLNPTIRNFNPKVLFRYNTTTQMIEVNRSIEFMDFLDTIRTSSNYRGICFDETTGNYLTEQKFRKALETICKINNNKKIDVICFDACLMAHAEVAFNIMPFAHFMVASQEVELGTGYDYFKVLHPLLSGTTTSQQFALNTVNAFKETYSKITYDYTQAAIDLKHFSTANETINTIAKILIEALKRQRNKSVHKAIAASASRDHCTYFDEPSYKDLHNFCSNLLLNLKSFELQTKEETHQVTSTLKLTLIQALNALEKCVMASVSGKNLYKSHGLSIYLPEKKLHPSYSGIEFSCNNYWFQFLISYLTVPM